LEARFVNRETETIVVFHRHAPEAAMIRMRSTRPRSTRSAPRSRSAACYEADANERGERHIWLETAMVDRLGAMRGPGQSYSDVILRLVEVEAQDLR
jgi:hypothetical protein